MLASSSSSGGGHSFRKYHHNSVGIWNQIWSKSKSLGRDSWELGSDMIRSCVLRSSGTTIRDVIVQQARQSNSIAITLLSADREVGLLRYWGLSGYLSQKKNLYWDSFSLRFFNHSRTERQQQQASTLSAATPSSKQGSPTTGRIAFMVTASMRQELTERLAYNEEQIRLLTPLQASLVLQHDVPSHELTSKLPDLERNWHLESLKQRQQALVAAALEATDAVPKFTLSLKVSPDDGEKQSEQNETDNTPEDHDETKGTRETNTSLVGKPSSADEETYRLDELTATSKDSEGNDPEPEQSPLVDDAEDLDDVDDECDHDVGVGVAAATEIDHPTIDDIPPIPPSKISFVDTIDMSEADLANIPPYKIWYEVQEVDDTSAQEPVVVGLYRDVAEAQLALETRQLFELRRAKDNKRLLTTSFFITRVIR